MTIPPTISSFSDLVGWLLREHHGGSPYRMAKALKVSAGLPFQWRDGVVRRPTDATLARLCEVYGLEHDAVIRIIYAPRMAAPIGGGSENAAPLPGEATLTYGADVLRLIGAWWHDLWAPWHRPLPSWHLTPRAWSMAPALDPAYGGA